MLRHFSHIRLFETLWPVTRQAPLTMGFSMDRGCYVYSFLNCIFNFLLNFINVYVIYIYVVMFIF